MKIAVMAAGGVGGYFGARLADAGNDVTFIARGRHLEALREGGLGIESALGDVRLQPVSATDDPAEVGPVDVVLFAVKLWDTGDAARACRPLLGEDTAVINFQNGVGGVEALREVLGPDHALGGTAHIAAIIAEPGLIRHTGTMAKLAFGETDNRRSARIEAFFEACRAADIEAHIPEDIERAIWEKFVFLAALSATTSAARQPVGPILAERDGRRQFRAVMEETAAVGRALDVDLSRDVVERLMAFADGLPGEMKSSMLGDLEAGRRIEVDWLSGAVSRKGRELGIATPLNDALYATLKPYAQG